MHFRGTRPLEVLLLPTELHPQIGPVWTGIVIARFPRQVKWYWQFSRRQNAASCHPWNRLALINHLQSELDLPGSVGVGGSQKGGRPAVLSRKDIDSNGFSRLNKLGRVTDKAILRDLDALVVTVQQVEGLRHQFHFDTVAGIDAAGESQVGGGVVRSEQRIAGDSGEPVVAVIAILVGIAGHS